MARQTKPFGTLALAATAGLLGLFTAGHPSRADLIGKWTFNENGGTTAFDSSGVGSDGTFTGSSSPAWVAGQGAAGTNYALHFDGVDDFVEYAHDPDYDVTGDFSMEAWIKLANTAGEGLIFGQSGLRYGLSAYASYAFQTIDNSPFHQAKGPFTADTWQHVVGVWDQSSGLAEVWVEGASVGFKFNVAAAPDHNGDSFWTGKFNASAQFGYLTGDIDEIRYYDHALTFAEIDANRIAGPTLIPEPSAALAGLACLACYRGRRSRFLIEKRAEALFRRPTTPRLPNRPRPRERRTNVPPVRTPPAIV